MTTRKGRRPIPMTRGGPVTITRADGTVETRGPYAPKVLRAILDAPDTGRPPPWLTAKYPGTCPVCENPITPGSRIDLRGWEHRVAIHHACTPHWKPGTG